MQLDEVALQRSQSIGTKAMKAALRGKRKADKEREALINAEGIDRLLRLRSIWKQRQLRQNQRVAIRTLRSKLLTASLSVASYVDPLNSTNLIFGVCLLPHTLKNKVALIMAVD